MNNKEAGFIALTSILIISALVLSVSLSVSLLSIEESNMSLGEQESHRALALANLCAETAVFKLESVFNYSGDESIIIGGESCDILDMDTSGNFNRTVKTQSTVSNYTKKVKVEVLQVSTTTQITSWEEVSDF